MNNILSGNGELPLLSEDHRIVAFESLEQWQIDSLTANPADSSIAISTNICLTNIDKICTNWMSQLTQEQWVKIKKQGSLFGIPLPQDWIKVWRIILKEPELRDSEHSTKGGRNIGTYTHLWNIWSMDCIEKYLDELDKELLRMVDEGHLYSEIGYYLLGKYGDKFWKKRKENTKTTPSQVVNNYLHLKMPTKICRGELTDILLIEIKRLQNNASAVV